MVPIYHPFERGVAEKVILAFAQDPEAQKAATEAGASKASLICSQVFGSVADPGCLSRNRPLSIPDLEFFIPDPHQRILIILTQKMVSKL